MRPATLLIAFAAAVCAQKAEEETTGDKINARATDDLFASIGAEWQADWSSVLASATEAGGGILTGVSAALPSPTWDDPLGSALTSHLSSVSANVASLTSEAGARASSLSSVLATATGGIASSLSSELSGLTSSLSAKVSSLRGSATATGTGTVATATATGLSNPAPAVTAALGFGALFGGAAMYANM